MNHCILIQSGHAEPVTVWVEPWGRDYTLLPHEEYRFTAVNAAADFHFHITWQVRDLLLYAEAACEDIIVHHGEVELPCGFNRQLRTDRAF